MTEIYSNQPGTTQSTSGERDAAAATEAVTRPLEEAVAAAGRIAQPQPVERGGEPMIDPGTGGGDTMVTRCRGFTGEGETDTQEEEKSTQGPCLVVTEGEPENPEGKNIIYDGPEEQGHVIRDPGLVERNPEEDRDPHAGGGCIRVAEPDPVKIPEGAPDTSDGTILALGAIMRTFS
jgi:hypothetical protein